ncbi:MAG: hypothetical protein NT111_02970 [Patescibacteria group bacterium]|nr:hypothetical protein [Patescibacteria group bacterium]
MNKPSGPSKPTHDGEESEPLHHGEEAATRAYEKKLAIERSIEPSDNSDQPFLPDPSDETGAEPSGGGYGAAVPENISPPAVIPPTPNPPAEPPRDGDFVPVTEVETAAGKIGVEASQIELEAAAVRKKLIDDEVRAAAEAARDEALKAANNQPPKNP